MKRLFRLLSPLIALALLAGASWALYRELQNYHWRDFVESLRGIPAGRLAVAVFLAVADCTILVGNDWIASRYLARRVRWGQLVMGSVAGYAASHNLGAAFGGTPVRYRFYTSWGASAGEVAAWISILTVSFVLGVLTLGGLVCLSQPDAVTLYFGLPLAGIRLLGATMIAAVGCYLTACLLWKDLRWRKRTVRMPSATLAAAQVLVGSADLCCAAGILFVLLPADLPLSYPAFLSVYLVAIVAAVSSHVPGGVGVFDLVMLKLVAHGDPHDLLAALLVYRAVYYLLPLTVGLVFVMIHEVTIHRR